MTRAVRNSQLSGTTQVLKGRARPLRRRAGSAAASGSFSLPRARPRVGVCPSDSLLKPVAWAPPSTKQCETGGRSWKCHATVANSVFSADRRISARAEPERHAAGTGTRHNPAPRFPPVPPESQNRRFRRHRRKPRTNTSRCPLRLPSSRPTNATAPSLRRTRRA